MMYGHYLQKKGQHIAIFCVSTTKLRNEHEEFYTELEKRWETLEGKRTLKFKDDERESKRARALGGDYDDVESTSQWSASHLTSASHGTGSHSKKGEEGSRLPYAFLPAEEKQRLREECQSAWDLAFVMCGIKFMAADNKYLRAAIQKTRGIPDFTLACSKTMRTSRLEKLNNKANENKDLRLKVGLKLGFAVTSDGWRSVAKRNYHNYILLSLEGPIFLTLEEVTGEGGAGTDIYAGFEAQFAKLDNDVVANILIGVTDTPSANRTAWRLLEAKHPKQFWIGCAAHEVSLLFKEWVRKVPEILQLFKEGHRIVKWVNNHSEILKLYRFIVPSHFEDRRKHCLMLYSPGDTRMATAFKMLHRILVLYPVLTDLVSRPEYETASQKALKQWSDAQAADKKLTAVNGKYLDRVKLSVQSDAFKERIEAFINSTKSAMYLLRLVDGQSPVIGKFYYSCALVDKHLRVLKEGNNVPGIDTMRAIFMKRWRRWHRPIHTFAYALDPCYQGHELSRQEKADCLQVHRCIVYSRSALTLPPACRQVIKKLDPRNWAKLKIEFDRWRTSGASIFPKEIWEAADETHAYQWWQSFGDDFQLLNVWAAKILSKPIAASACEFNWSDVSNVVTKRTQRLKDDNIEKIVNTRAMTRLEAALSRKVMLGNIPKLDDFLDTLVNDAIATSGHSGDDVADADELEEESESDDDLDVVGEEDAEENLYELGDEPNAALQDDVTTRITC